MSHNRVHICKRKDCSNMQSKCMLCPFSDLFCKEHTKLMNIIDDKCYCDKCVELYKCPSCQIVLTSNRYECCHCGTIRYTCEEHSGLTKIMVENTSQKFICDECVKIHEETLQNVKCSTCNSVISTMMTCPKCNVSIRTNDTCVSRCHSCRNCNKTFCTDCHDINDWECVHPEQVRHVYHYPYFLCKNCKSSPLFRLFF